MTLKSIQNGGTASFIIKIGGSAIPDRLEVFSVHVNKKVNRISTATIVILDGDAATGKFDASSSALFVPGGEIIIEAGYDSYNEIIFKGIITKQVIRIDPLIGSALEVECHDAAVKMIVGRKNAIFQQKKDSEIISSIIASYSLQPNVTSTTTVWPEQVQYYATDWDFILARAEANGLIVTTLNGKVSVIKPDADTTPVLLVSFGNGLMEFNAELNSLTQLENVKASAWDYKDQVIVSQQANPDVAGPGNLSSKKLSEVIGLPGYQLQTSALLEKEELSSWSKAQIIKSEYSKIRGEAKFQGSNLVEPGKYITLGGLGDRFNGDHLISGVDHLIENGNWFTEVTIGLSPEWFIAEQDIVAPSAAGLLPGARGLFTGTVKKMCEDPDSQFRILVEVPLFDQNRTGIWARLSNFYSTNGAGAFFLPEVGDEVVLGFLNEDPRYPVILGSMYSSPKVKPFNGLVPDEKNKLKAIVSRSGIMIQFDDEQKILTIETPSKNTVVISDKDKKIVLQDENENNIVMSADGITIRSQKNISMEAAGTISLKGEQGVRIASPGGDVKTSGLNISEQAESQYTASGSSTATISSGMQLTLKSAMIMIN